MRKDEITLESLKAKFKGPAIAPSRYYAKNINGSKVKEIRAQMGMTQDNFALYFGISKKTLEAWEQGNKDLKGTNRLLFSIIDDFDSVKNSVFGTFNIQKPVIDFSSKPNTFIINSLKYKVAENNVYDKDMQHKWKGGIAYG